jgi:hypothetical protein
MIMAEKKPEQNPLDGIAGNALSSFLSGLLKVKSLKLNLEFPGFTVELKSKEPPPKTPDSAPLSPQK